MLLPRYNTGITCFYCVKMCFLFVTRCSFRHFCQIYLVRTEKSLYLTLISGSLMLKLSLVTNLVFLTGLQGEKSTF